ncbi:MAG: LytTR family transcriptional regulator [Lachnospiraceae bacterium]|nr:LytTR family transcriptional regulator [Lachnospiraceae bacterium]
MKKRINLESDTLRVLSGFYQNDMALFSRYTNECFLFDVPYYETGEQTPLSIRDLPRSTNASIRYAVRKAAPSVQTQSGPFCSILMKYTLDRYRNEIPDLQLPYQLLVCWLNVSTQEDNPVWRITLFQISNTENDIDMKKTASDALFVPATPQNALVRERRPAYTSSRPNLIRIKDKDHSIHFLEKDDIIWAESDHMNSIIHTHAGSIRANATLSQLAKDTLSCLYRPHISYLVNPLYLYEINNKHLIMTDGTIIPIPERRLAQVKKDLSKSI